MSADISLGPADGVLVPDAGVVIAFPYFVRLWSTLGLVKELAFVDSAAAERAAQLMQFLVSGETQPDEPASPLSRLMCGLPPARADGDPAESFTSSAHERETIDGMLAAMIAHWKVLGHTSIEGLRKTFLQRKGRLLRGEGCWTLTVEPASFDMLLDQLPWGYATCRLPWMPEAIAVSWR